MKKIIEEVKEYPTKVEKEVDKESEKEDVPKEMDLCWEVAKCYCSTCWCANLEDPYLYVFLGGVVGYLCCGFCCCKKPVN